MNLARSGWNVSSGPLPTDHYKMEYTVELLTVITTKRKLGFPEISYDVLKLRTSRAFVWFGGYSGHG